VKKDFLKASSGTSGFVKEPIAPVSGKPELAFGPWDAVMVAALVLGSIVAMRFLIGH
jgi:hypothetical protein